MKAVMLSIQPKRCALIASGKKTIEVRKTRPKVDTPFKCYIYCTKGTLLYEDFPNGKESREIKLADYRYNRQSHSLNGKVIGKFVCYKVTNIFADCRFWLRDDALQSCLDVDEMRKYANGANGLYGWHISDLVIYDKPKELCEFRVICNQNGCDEHCPFVEWEMTDNGEIFYDCKYAGYIPLTRPSQSWCYVEEYNNL